MESLSGFLQQAINRIENNTKNREQECMKDEEGIDLEHERREGLNATKRQETTSTKERIDDSCQRDFTKTYLQLVHDSWVHR